jgi:GcrA cell cycle regulator
MPSAGLIDGAQMLRCARSFGKIVVSSGGISPSSINPRCQHWLTIKRPGAVFPPTRFMIRRTPSGSGSQSRATTAANSASCAMLVSASLTGMLPLDVASPRRGWIWIRAGDAFRSSPHHGPLCRGHRIPHDVQRAWHHTAPRRPMVWRWPAQRPPLARREPPHPRGIAILARLLAMGVITPCQIEQAAGPVSVRTNGSTKPAPPTPLRVTSAPAPEQPALARAEAAALADPGLTTAEKVMALTPGTCRWPRGDPDRPDFRFCGALVARGPYCERHRSQAYRAPLTGSGHGVRSGRVAHGWRSPTAKRLSTGVSTTVSTDPVGGSVDRSVDESIAAQAQDFRAL